MENLELATAEELITELKSRYDGILIMTVRAHKTEHGLDMYEDHFKGGSAVCLGLAEIAKARLLVPHVKEDTYGE